MSETSPNFDIERFYAGCDLSRLAEDAWAEGSWSERALLDAIALIEERFADPSILFFESPEQRELNCARDLGLSLLRLAHLGHPFAAPFEGPILKMAPFWLAGNAFARREAFAFAESPLASRLAESIALSESALIPWDSFLLEVSEDGSFKRAECLVGSILSFAKRGCANARTAFQSLRSSPPQSPLRSLWERHAIGESVAGAQSGSADRWL